MKIKKIFSSSVFSGILIGLINGLFGAGGGIVAVEVLKIKGFSQSDAHKSAIAIILPLSVLSFVFYLTSDKFVFSDGIPFIFPGLLGALFGSYIINKISDGALRKIFAVVLIIAGGRMLFT